MSITMQLKESLSVNLVRQCLNNICTLSILNDSVFKNQRAFINNILSNYVLCLVSDKAFSRATQNTISLIHFKLS